MRRSTFAGKLALIKDLAQDCFNIYDGVQGEIAYELRKSHC
jgi:hypothetical protein